jgi:hypothetical protein
MAALFPTTSETPFSETSTKSANRLLFPQQRQQQRQLWRFLGSATRVLLGVLATTAVASTVTTPIPVDAFVVVPQVVFGGVAARGNRDDSASDSGPDPLMVRSPLLSSPMQSPAHLWRSSCFSTSKSSQENSCENDDDDETRDTTLELLQNQLVYIQALEERNKAQLDSFVDEEDQWESMEDYEKELLSSKEELEKQLNELLLSSEGQA